ncbi:MAG: hypothetical protein F7C32_02005 [Desulfurococcales archaeon]|nr:hypothetical protein [Desulfurococcales archaeon]
MTVEELLTILHKRLDLIEYAEKLLDLGQPLERETSAELYRVATVLRRLRHKLLEYVEANPLGEDEKTLLEYYAIISSTTEKQVVSKIALALEDPDKEAEFASDVEEVERLSSLIKEKV